MPDRQQCLAARLQDPPHCPVCQPECTPCSCISGTPISFSTGTWDQLLKFGIVLAKPEHTATLCKCDLYWGGMREVELESFPLSWFLLCCMYIKIHTLFTGKGRVLKPSYSHIFPQTKGEPKGSQKEENYQNNPNSPNSQLQFNNKYKSGGHFKAFLHLAA